MCVICLGFTINGLGQSVPLVALDEPPYLAPGWRLTSEGDWYNDLSNELLRIGEPVPALPDPGPAEYRATFTTGPASWRSLVHAAGAGRDVEAPWDVRGWLRLAGPWWPDTNHDVDDDGRRVAHVIAYLYSSSLQPHAHHHAIDFRGGSFTVRLRAEGLDLRGGRLVFWVQSKPSGHDRFVNLALPHASLDAVAKTGEWVTAHIQLSAAAPWQCLGPRPAKADTYGCAPVEEVLADVNRDFGLLIYPLAMRGGDTEWLADAPVGTLLIDEIGLRYRLNPRDVR